MTSKPTEPSPEVKQEETVCGAVAAANRLVPGAKCVKPKGHTSGHMSSLENGGR